MALLDDFIDRLVQTYPASERGLSLFRIVFALAFILFLAHPRFLWAIGYPDIFWKPPLPLSLFDCFGSLQFGLVCGFPPSWLVVVMEGLLALSAVLLLFGYRTFYTSILFSGIFIILNTFRYSFGKIDHEIMLVITPAIMAFSGWGSYYSLDAQRQTTQRQANKHRTYPSYCLLFLALSLSVGFLSAGLPKAISWVDFDLSTSGVRNWVVRSYFVGGDTDWLAPVFAYTSNVYLWEAIDYAGVFFELGMAISVLHGSLFKRFVVLAVFFHLTNFLMLEIGFTLFFPVYAAFLPWTRVARYLEKTGWTPRLTNFFNHGYMWLFALAFVPYYYLIQNIEFGQSRKIAVFIVSLVVILSLINLNIKSKLRKVRLYTS